MPNILAVNIVESPSNVSTPLKSFLKRSLASFHVILPQAAVSSAFKLDAVLIHLNNLDQVQMPSKSLVDSSFYVVHSLKLRQRVRYLAQLIGTIGMLIDVAETGIQ